MFAKRFQSAAQFSQNWVGRVELSLKTILLRTEGEVYLPLSPSTPGHASAADLPIPGSILVYFRINFRIDFRMRFLFDFDPKSVPFELHFGSQNRNKSQQKRMIFRAVLRTGFGVNLGAPPDPRSLKTIVFLKENNVF